MIGLSISDNYGFPQIHKEEINKQRVAKKRHRKTSQSPYNTLI